MDERERIVRNILAIADATSRTDDRLSALDALERAEYSRHRPHLGSEDLAAVLKRAPELVDQWICYAENKRVARGWYVRRSGEVGFYGGSPVAPERFETQAEAVAEFILRELDGIVAAKPLGRR